MLLPRSIVLPPGKEGVADSEEALEGERHGAVGRAHEADLRDRDDHGQGGHAGGLVVAGPEHAQREQMDRTRHVDLKGERIAFRSLFRV